MNWKKTPLYLTLLVSVATSGYGNSIELSITSGQLRGTVENGIQIFRGVPYAQPPIGSLRWAAPKQPTPWEGVLDASEFGPWCPQPDFQAIQSLSDGKGDIASRTVSTEGGIFILDTPSKEDASEDCLTLNIWAPSNAERAPVIVWLHGASGSGSQPFYDGTRFAENGIVLITINFRMWTLGKFSHPALRKEAAKDSPLALYYRLDQLAALRWVQDNIAAFGGDANNVTVAGQSAGGAAVVGLLATPSAKGLFHRAIIQSSSGFWAPLTPEEHESLGSMIATAAGLKGADATVKQLRSLPAEKLNWVGTHALDGRWWRESKHQAIEQKHIIDVPLLIGWNSFDGSSLRQATETVLAKTPNEVLAEYPQDELSEKDLAYAVYTDRHNGAPARWMAAQTADGAPTYLYYFSYVLSAAKSRGARGAEHGREIFHIFDSWAKIPPSNLPPHITNLEDILSQQDKAMTQAMHQCWVTFARMGKPECSNVPKWPRYNPSTDELMEFGEQIQVRRNLRKKQLDAQEAAINETIHQRRQSSLELMKLFKQRVEHTTKGEETENE